MSALKDSDFYVTTATVIPVIFLALVLEGGLWAWMAEKITKAKDPTTHVRAFVSWLQVLGVLIVSASTISEILAISALMNDGASQATKEIIFYSTVFLVILLGLMLVARIPGLWVVSSEDLALPLKDGEELEWSGYCAMLTPRPTWPWIWGKLFITSERITWKAPAQLGLFAPSALEIRSDGIRDVKSPTKGWWYFTIRVLPSNNLIPSPPRGRIAGVTTGTGRTYYFCVSADYDGARHVLASLIRPATASQGAE